MRSCAKIVLRFSNTGGTLTRWNYSARSGNDSSGINEHGIKLSGLRCNVSLEIIRTHFTFSTEPGDHMADLR